MLPRQLHPLIEGDLAHVNAAIRDQLRTDLVLIQAAVEYIIQRPWRIRPAMTLMVARALGGFNAHHYALAGTVELIRGALALHGEVGESGGAAQVRGGADALFGDDVKILLGDLLYTGAFKLTVSLRHLPATRVIATATNVIAQGEVMYLEASRHPALNTDRYLEIVRARTSKLFEAAAQGAAILCGAPAPVEQALSAFGLHYGTAYCLLSEIERVQTSLDASTRRSSPIQDPSQAFTQNPKDTKDTKDGEGLDVRVSIGLCWPVVHAMASVGKEEAGALCEQMRHNRQAFEQRILPAIASSDALAQCRALADSELASARAALGVLPDSEFKTELLRTATVSVEPFH